VTDQTTYRNNVLVTPLVPEEAMGAFIGENPNGVWTLTISDDAVGDGGALNQWSLDIATTTQFVMVADENITIFQRSLPSEGAIHANGNLIFNPGKPSIHAGNLTTVGRIEILKNNTITGNAAAGGRIVANGTITGVIRPSANVPNIPLPVLDFTAGGNDVNVPKNGVTVLDPGVYGEALVRKNGTLALRRDLALGGNYFFETLEVLVSAKLTIDVTNGPVNINVVEKLGFGKAAKVIISSGDAGSKSVTLNTLQETNLDIGQGAKVLGTINAPEAQVRLLANSAFKGLICAETIQAHPGTVFLPHGSATVLPKADPSDEEESEVTSNQSPVTSYQLEQNYPNPFNPSTVISFALPEAGKVTVNIYNAAGQLVRTLVDGEKLAGRHQLHWNARNESGKPVAAGVYLYQIVTQGKAGNTSFTQTKRMTLLK